LSGAEIPDLESLCRLARQRLDLLNADLLAESLAARRRGYGGLGRLTAALEALAANGAERLRAERIAAALRAAAPVSDGDPIPSEPYAALGLAPGAGLEEVKTAFRKLAVRHHPDTGAGDRERFLRIETAYREILKRLEV
jgi:DnaJ-domain-containing protein 1